MPFEAVKRWAQDNGKRVDHYAQALARAHEWRKKNITQLQYSKFSEMPWEFSRHGKIKHLLNEHMDIRARTVDLYMQELPPGGRSGKHRHMADEVLYILEGKGYDMHWDMDLLLKDKYYWIPRKEGVKYEWEEGDLVYIPVNTIHQHFNADPTKPARFLSMSNRMFKYMGYDDLEQIEDAPDHKQNK